MRGTMKKQAFNPYLPTYEYIPDGEPYVFGDRLYIYGSHDRFNGSAFCQNDYVCWSAPTDDLSSWRYEGVLYRKEQDPDYREGNCLYAPDVTIGADGRYYLYYTLDMTGIMAAAVSDCPVGPYRYLGKVHYENGTVVGENPDDIFQFDPGVLCDDDGRIWLYSGFGPKPKPDEAMRYGGRRMDGAYCMELLPDMLTVKSEPVCILPKLSNAKGTEYEAHPFFEASSIRKINGLYYLVYSSVWNHELCYAVSNSPNRDFHFGGTIVSNGDIGLSDYTMEHAANYIGNNHGGMVNVNGQWYIFYHRHTNYNSHSRQGCAEPITILPDGSIPQAEMTSCGLNGGALEGTGRYSTAIVCNLYSAKGAGYSSAAGKEREAHPALTQTGEDRMCNPDQYITNMTNGSAAGFKYFNLTETTEIEIEVQGSPGVMEIRDGRGKKPLCTIPFYESAEYRTYRGNITCNNPRAALIFTVETNGTVDFRSFTLR